MPSPISHFHFSRARSVGLLAALVALAAADVTAPAQAQTSLGAKVKPMFGKVSSPISALYNDLTAAKAQRRTFSAASASQGTGLLTTSTSVAAEIAVTGSVATVKAQLLALGVQITGQYGPHFDVILPINLIDDVGKLAGVAYVAPNYGAASGVGAVTSQGDRAMRADIARSNGSVDGTGQKVGVISDSFNTSGDGSYAADQTSGDLPAGVTVVEDYSTNVIDEGRAMLQIVHDVAPGAGLAFATGFTGEAGMAANIGKLRTQAGCTVITDDIYYFAAPFFTDGLVAQAIDQCVNAGVPYFVLANNQGKDSYESDFNATTVASVGSFTGPFVAHDFDPGPGVDVTQTITIPNGRQARIVLEWDDVWKSLASTSSGDVNDFDIFLFNSSDSAVLASGNTDNVGGNPAESLSYTNNTGAAVTGHLFIRRYSGTATPRIKYISFNGGATINEYATNSATTYGNSNAARGLTIGAAYYGQTPRYGQTPPLLESYSSRGGIPILRNPDGTAITSVTRAKPDIVAIDGVDTTFFGSDSDSTTYPNFFGTSAAAPHAAAVAALLLQKKPSSTPDQIYSAMRSTAIDMGTAGFDNDSGYGLINADVALDAVQAQSGPNFVVNNAGDDGDGVCNASGVGDGCTLREAINAANSNSDTSAITFDATVFATKKTISVGGGLPDATTNLTITGSAAGVTITAPDPGSGALLVASGTVNLVNLTFANCQFAGVQTSSTGNILVSGCSFTRNSIGAVLNHGTNTFQNCTFVGNTNLAIETQAGTTLDSCTLVNNATGIERSANTTTVTNSILVDNITNLDNEGGTFSDGGHNLTTGTATAAGLQVDSNGKAVLADNGGPTQTVALVSATGTAVDTGSTTLTTDQRGTARPQGSADDIGAFEFVPPNNPPVISSVIITPGAPLTNDTLTANVEASDAESDMLTYSYVWKKNGTVISGQTNRTLDLSVAGNGDEGDSITVTVTAHDGSADSTPRTSAPVTIGNVAPVVVSVDPQDANDKVGAKRTFTLTMSDANGAKDIREMWLLINAQLNWGAGATLIYRPSSSDPTNGQLFLRRGDDFLPPITIGTGASASAYLDNGAVRVVATDVTVSVAGGTITLALPLTIRDGLIGANTLFARAQDAAGATDPASQSGDMGFVRSGTYTVTSQFSGGATNSAPTLSDLTPKVTSTTLNASGIAPNPQSIGFFFQDQDGTGDLQEVWFLAGNHLGWAHSATFVFYPRTRRLVLRSDDGSTFLGGGQIGTAGTLENSQVKVDLSKVKLLIYNDGKSLGLSLPLQAKTGLLGHNNIWLRVQDSAGATSPGGDAQGFVLKGNWDIKKVEGADAKPSTGNS